jgi:hypothetical protein
MAKGYHTINVSKPVQGYVVMTNMYWLCVDGDPEKAIFFNGTAQCNKHAQIPDRILEYTKQKTGWNIEIVFLETSYRPQT